jgi:hypothetical protein
MDNVGYIGNVRYMDDVRYMESGKYSESRHTEETNRSCYHFEKIYFNNSKDILLNIDATYIIHLENNGRLDSVMNQLNEFRPTKEVFILHNKGYKKCDKDGYINKPALDLIDAFLYIFKDAQQKNYKHVLVLEDDFIFSNRIKDKKVQQHIMNFINREKYDIYALGCIPALQKAYNNNVSISLYGGATHAMIYSRDCIDKTLQIDRKSITDWDGFTGQTFRKYMYNEPLCYQLFPETENQKYWGKNVVGIIKLLKLDTQVEPGYSIAYIASRGVYGLCIILVVWLFITVFRI